MSERRLLLDGETLTLEEIREVATGRARVELAPAALERVERARALVERTAAGDVPTYGINTGFGTLSEVRIDRKDLRTLQRNLILSHAAGVGQPLPLTEARALLLLRANVLARASGVRLKRCSSHGDAQPRRGAGGARARLRPQASRRWHIWPGPHRRRRGLPPGRAAAEGRGPRRARLEPVCWRPGGADPGQRHPGHDAVGTRRLRAEALAEGGHRGHDGGGLLGSVPLAIRRCSRIPAARVAAHLRTLLADLTETATARYGPYSLCCRRSTARHDGWATSDGAGGRGNAANNPLVFADEADRSGGNFHGQPVSLASTCWPSPAPSSGDQRGGGTTGEPGLSGSLPSWPRPG